MDKLADVYPGGVPGAVLTVGGPALAGYLLNQMRTERQWTRENKNRDLRAQMAMAVVRRRLSESGYREATDLLARMNPDIIESVKEKNRAGLKGGLVGLAVGATAGTATVVGVTGLKALT